MLGKIMSAIVTRIVYFFDMIWMRKFNPTHTPISNYLCPASWLEKRVEAILARNIGAITKQQKEFDPYTDEKKIIIQKYEYNALSNIICLEIEENDSSIVHQYRLLSVHESISIQGIELGISTQPGTEEGNFILAENIEFSINNKIRTFKFIAIIENSKQICIQNVMDEWKKSLIENNPREICNKGMFDSINQCFSNMVYNTHHAALAIIIDDMLWCVNKGRTRIVLNINEKVTQCTFINSNSNFKISRFSLKKIENSNSLLIFGSRNIFGRCPHRMYGFQSHRIGEIASTLHKDNRSMLEISGILVNLASPMFLSSSNTVIVAKI